MRIFEFISFSDPNSCLASLSLALCSINMVVHHSCFHINISLSLLNMMQKATHPPWTYFPCGASAAINLVLALLLSWQWGFWHLMISGKISGRIDLARHKMVDKFIISAYLLYLFIIKRGTNCTWSACTDPALLLYQMQFRNGKVKMHSLLGSETTKWFIFTESIFGKSCPSHWHSSCWCSLNTHGWIKHSAK